MSASADYVHTKASDLWELINLNPGVRVNTTASGTIQRIDPTFVTNVWQRANVGSYDYDALNVVLEKRDSNNWSGRVSYTLANSRGNTTGALTATDQFQTVDSLNLDLNQGPTDFDRRHNLVFSGRGQVPHTRGMSCSCDASARSRVCSTMRVISNVRSRRSNAKHRFSRSWNTPTACCTPVS